MRATSAWENNVRNPSRSLEWSYKLCDLTEWDNSNHSNLLGRTTALTSNTAPEHALTHDNTHGHTEDRGKKGFENNKKLSSKYPLGRKHSFAFPSGLLICQPHLL